MNAQTTTLLSPLDARELRQVLGRFVTGVTVVTTVDASGRPQGLTANSFSSVSLDPPLVLWSQSKTAPSHAVFSSAPRFTVNILAEDQVDISNRFARGSADKFDGIAVRQGLGGIPLIDGCAAYLECKRVATYPGGDHDVFIGQVEQIERNARPALAFGGGRYLVAQPHEGSSSLLARGPNIARLRAIRMATHAIAALSEELGETLGVAVWGNHGPTVIRWEEASGTLGDTLRTGLVLPVLGSATGLAFAAWMPSAVVSRFIDAELGARGMLGPDPELPTMLAEIRASGFARRVGLEQFSDLYGGAVSAISVPVFGADGSMVLALGAIGRAGNLQTATDSAVVRRLRETADRLSAQWSVGTPSS